MSALVGFFASCETGDLDLLTSPNSITTDSADPNFILNDIQLTFNGIVGGYSGASRPIIRMTNQFGNYNGAVTDNTLSGEWASSYQMFANVDLIEQINAEAEVDQDIPFHVGMAQVLEAYSYFLLVDYLGDVVFTEANNPGEFPNPMLDSGASVYDAQLELLDAAIANLNSGGTGTRLPDDLFYGTFEASNWIALANTLKIRAYLNMRLTNPSRAAAGINAVASSNIIDQVSEDFQFAYSSSQDEPESRHPDFVGNYLSVAGVYMSNNFLDYLNVGDAEAPFIETMEVDPRARHYVYRQTDEAPSGSDLPCAGDSRYDYCYVGNLYWGRDHTDEAGIPNDGNLRSTWGIYPAGGAYDSDQFEQTENSDNAGGEGVRPIYLSSFTHFALAEAALTIGTAGNPAGLLELGIRRSMEKVSGFAGSPSISSGEINDYVNRVLAEFNAGNNNAKLNIIAREYFLAAWGNGIEPYNTYRRTGAPDLQSPIINAPGAFPRIFRYPEGEVSNNPNVQQQAITDRTFWDNNPAGFID